MTAVEAWRLANLLVSLWALAWLLGDLWLHWRRLTRRRLFLTLSLLGLLASVVVGTAWRLWFGPYVAASPATALVSASCVWAILGLWVSRGDPS